MKKYYIGLDIGTDSVGIACTDEEYNLLRIKGKDAWAVRLFDEAQDASGRRTKRSMRRRLARRKQRIDFLQGLFAPYMEDNLFFIRLNNSMLQYEDKDERLKSEFALFSDEKLTDKEFYKQFPTIYHLRKALIDGKQKYDLRYYYLALHHIIKYRGHFLFNGENMSDIRDLGKLFEELNQACENTYDDPPKFDPGIAERFKEIALSKDMGVKDKSKKVEGLIGKVDAAQKAMIKLLLGGTAKLQDLFDYEDKKSISLKNITDEDFASLSDDVTDEEFALLETIKRAYGFLIFERVLNGHAFISEAMTELYEKHKSDLNKLKKLLRDSGLRDVYNLIFKRLSDPNTNGKLNNYVGYIGHTKIGGKKIRTEKVKKEEDFRTFLKNILKEHADEIKDKDTLGVILNELESEDCNFLPKILHADNGTFPHQINGAELEKILTNLCRDYPEFGQKDGKYTIAEKIKKIFEYRIPYYVGPLNTYHSESLHGRGGNSWMVRTNEEDKERITPWNFDDKVDKAKSNEEFMRRMTNKCSYLYGKDVLPKCSIIYQKYNVLNQLNTLKINEHPISVEMKKEIFDNVFLKEKKVTKKKIKDYLIKSGHIKREEEGSTSLSGIDGDEFACSMSSYISMKNILGDFVDKHTDIIEEIILWYTLNTDKSIVEKSIRKKFEKYPELIDKIKMLNGLNFTKFGRLSREFLCETYGGADPVTGAAYTIIERLYETNCNLIQLLYSGDYNFLAAVDAINKCDGKISEDVTYEDIESLYISPKVRRGVWQALQMVDEYVKAFGRAPDKIFVEVTRHDEQEKKRKDSRKQKLLNLYKNKELKETADDIGELLAELNGKENGDLRSERLYLYFLQLGRCAYSGEKIDLGILATDLYDVDHIVPQSLVKDDSIDNKVLVRKVINNYDKRDDYPIPEDVVSPNMRSVWKMWHEKRLISDKKYALLSRRGELQSADFEGFINRQLVETDQSAKAVAELLKRKYNAQGTKIVYSKASNVSDFRDKYKIVKCRETNDLHHARDAYLNIAVGNVYDTKFSSLRDYYHARNFGSDTDELRLYNLKRLFDRDIEGAWDKNSSLKQVKSVCAKSSMIVTRYTYISLDKFYDETVYPKSDADKRDIREHKSLDAPRKQYLKVDGEKIPLSKEKYGGYNSLKTAYFAVVESDDKKGKKIKTIERVPVFVEYNIHGDAEKLTEYFKDKGLENPKILIPKLKNKTLLSINGTRLWISGVSTSGKSITVLLHNAEQWRTDEMTDRYIKAIAKLYDWVKTKLIKEDDKDPVYEMHKNKDGVVTLQIDAEQNLKIYKKIIEELGKKRYCGISAFSNVREKLQQRTVDFMQLTTLKQSITLYRLVQFMHCDGSSADLSLLHLGSRIGEFKMNQDITDKDVRIIHQSPCGLTTRVRKI